MSVVPTPASPPPPRFGPGEAVRWRVWLVVAWIVATLLLATGWGASTRTEGWLTPRLREAGLSASAAASLHRGLRKVVHVLAYASFALLARAALRGRPQRAPAALLLAFALALLDESVQGLFPERGGSPLDVLLDCSGAALALFLVGWRQSGLATSPSTPARP